MPPKKRYIVNMSFMLLADSPEQAKIEAEIIAEQSRYINDDCAMVMSITQKGFGSIKEKEIYNYLKS